MGVITNKGASCLPRRGKRVPLGTFGLRRHSPADLSEGNVWMQLPSIVPPPHGEAWPEAIADDAAMNWMWLEEAARFAAENETPWPVDLRLHLEGGYFEPPPFNEILGSGAAARTRQWPGAAPRPQGRVLGRHRPGRFHLLRRQKLSELAGRHRRRWTG